MGEPNARPKPGFILYASTETLTGQDVYDVARAYVAVLEGQAMVHERLVRPGKPGRTKKSPLREIALAKKPDLAVADDPDADLECDIDADDCP